MEAQRPWFKPQNSLKSQLVVLRNAFNACSGVEWGEESETSGWIPGAHSSDKLALMVIPASERSCFKTPGGGLLMNDTQD